MSDIPLDNESGVTLAFANASNVGGRLRNIIYMTESGTYTKPDWLKFVRVRGVGGGGGGARTQEPGASAYSLSNAGGGGAYFEKKILAADIAETETVTVGDGGQGGYYNSSEDYQDDGLAGGTTSFGSHCSAAGGDGGMYTLAVSSTTTKNTDKTNGGDAVGGDINISGKSSSLGRYLSGTGLLSTSMGGNSILGFGGGFFVLGEPGLGYGGGGGGAYSWPSSTTQPGGDGAPGILIIEEYE